VLLNLRFYNEDGQKAQASTKGGGCSGMQWTTTFSPSRDGVAVG